MAPAIRKNGGLDCSGAVQWLLLQEGLAEVPRISLNQYHWLDRAGLLHQLYDWSSPASVFRRLRPGDLLFWEDTFDAKRNPNITHVMVYLGYDDTKKKHLMFGAKSSKKGENGAAVDIFEFKWPHQEKKRPLRCLRAHPVAGPLNARIPLMIILREILMIV